MKRKSFSFLLCLVLICTMVINLTGCATQVQADNLMDGIKSNSGSGKAVTTDFISSQMNLSVNLFKSSVQASKDKNVLISPLSIQLALAMTANGACGQTKDEMEKLLGGNIGMEELNEYLFAYVKGLPSGDEYKVEIANSIWFRDDENRLTVEKDFLQTNADYYGAQVYKSAFDAQTLKDINTWVDTHTDGMIEKILDEIDQDAIMYLINALVFDAQWQHVYEKSDIFDSTFTSVLGEKQDAEFMRSEEYYYIDDKTATGFIKDYKDSKYSFVALLPNEELNIAQYIGGLTSQSLMNTIKNAKSETVLATMPKFSYGYSLKMNEVLAELGMSTAFDPMADFSKLGNSSSGNIYINSVLHKTFITVDELGTKAGAATMVGMDTGSAMQPPHVVRLDRPFVYMIMDNANNLPIFIGTVMGVN